MLQQKAEAELESARLHLLRFDHEITALNQQKSAKMAKIEKLAVLKVKICGEIEKKKNEIETFEKDLKGILKRNEWIEDHQK